MITNTDVEEADILMDDSSLEEMKMDFERREFALLSLVSSLQKELHHTRTLVRDWQSDHIVQDNQLRTVIIDPTINLEIKELRKKLYEKDQLIKQSREELQAQSFNYNKVAGFRLANKCRTLLEENSDLGRCLVNNQLQPLNILLSNQKKYISTLKSEMRQLRELNDEIDQDNDSLTTQLSEITVNLM